MNCIADQTFKTGGMGRHDREWLCREQLQPPVRPTEGGVFCVRPDGFDGEDFDDLSREQFFHECVGLDFVELHDGY